MNKDEIEALLFKLREVRRITTMETASFGFPTEKVSSNPHMGEPIIDMPVTDFIRAKTEIWRDTWVISPLDEVITELAARAKHGDGWQAELREGYIKALAQS
jgi:hypothetical protein